MSVYIKNMELPKGHPVCIVIDAAGQARYYDLNNNRYADDKLFEVIFVPPHGQLIDADKMKESIRKQTAFFRLIGGEMTEIAETLEKGILQEIANASTVIEAEEGK